MSARMPGKRKKAITKSQRANVLFPVGRLHRYLKQGTPKYRIGVGAAVYAASVIEYLTGKWIVWKPKLFTFIFEKLAN